MEVEVEQRPPVPTQLRSGTAVERIPLSSAESLEPHLEASKKNYPSNAI